MSKTKKWTVHEKRPTEPRWFTHNGHFDTDPTSMKKNGAGRNNWGQPGDEMDKSEIKMFNKSSGRRNSNHDVNQDRMNQLSASIDASLTS
ncbi:ATPase stabilizing factor 15 kDa protein [Lodderomyces elongisporus]|uniref:Hyaluronan/mRNA-binding protein domain-containing protein n=1 Tax=Lodderomyces elongisporus (strain ATCC 11503 / CBS 2605 / JCM 1781 / NBRC 1676 / NRRL YB-4239) TaxID=379508 RepID=A5DV02_LODEL|nr:ATPase stabilizing factor 15 kDa protein [Lodderomyces elongisporus]EDK43010.1 hypothetical protein LELG_01188 [Lodderomyces elongisporus NRRL YB-4239]WLF77439.1 ATPase stabilizing factor 15 kDa protein [Lodderomyces elongisporus]